MPRGWGVRVSRVIPGETGDDGLTPAKRARLLRKAIAEFDLDEDARALVIRDLKELLDPRESPRTKVAAIQAACRIAEVNQSAAVAETNQQYADEVRQLREALRAARGEGDGSGSPPGGDGGGHQGPG